MSQNQSSEPAMDDPSTENQGFRLSWAEDDEVDLSHILLSIEEINLGIQGQLVSQSPSITIAEISSHFRYR